MVDIDELKLNEVCLAASKPASAKKPKQTKPSSASGLRAYKVKTNIVPQEIIWNKQASILHLI